MDDTRQIPFFDYSSLFLRDEEEILETMIDVMRRGAFILQKDLAEFEKHLAEYLDVGHAIGVADGTNALKLALLAAGIGPGDQVILPAHTYVASAAAIHYVGAQPALVECGADHLIDPDSVRAAVTSSTRAIMPVQLNGRTADMAALGRIAAEHDLVLIEDAAQALGSKFGGQHAGSFGAAGTFSFYPAKLLGCFGDGGAVVTNDDAMAMRLRLLRDHGRDESGDVVSWGTNCRLDNLQAAVLDLKLRTFDKDVERRREIARAYQRGLGDLDELVLPPAPDADPDHFDVYQNYEIEAERRDALQTFLEQRGVRTIVQFGARAIHQHPGLGFSQVRLQFTEKLYQRMLLLPMNTSMTDDDAGYVIAQIRQFFRAG